MADKPVIVPIEFEVKDLSFGDIDVREITKDISKELSSLKDTVNSIFSNVDKSKMSKALTSTVNNLEKGIEKVTVAEHNYEKALIDSGKTSKAYKSDLEKLESLRSKLAEQEDTVRGTKAGITRFEPGSEQRYERELAKYNEMLKEVQELERETSDIRNYALSGTQDKLLKIVEAYRKLTDAVKDTNDSISNTNQSIQDNNLSESYQKDIASAEKLRDKLKELSDKSKIMEEFGASDRQWGNLRKDVADTKAELDGVISRLREAVKTGSAFTLGEGSKKDLSRQINSISMSSQNYAGNTTGRANTNQSPYTADYQAMVDELDKLSNKLNEVDAKTKKLYETGRGKPGQFVDLKYDAELLNEKIQTIIQSMREMTESGKAFKPFATGREDGELSKLDTTLENVKNTMSDVTARSDEKAKSFKGESDAANKDAKSVKNSSNTHKAFSKVIKSVGKVVGKLGSGIKNTTSKLLNFGKAGKKYGSSTSGTFKKLFKDFLMFGLGFRTAYYAVKRLRKITYESMKEMAKQFPEINKPLSEFIQSFNRLRGSIATAFQPIASVVIPILKQFMDYLSGVLEAIGKFTATLSGQRYIYKAIANDVDVATGQMGEATNKLADYDKLQVVNDDSNSNSLGVTYEKSEVEGAASEFAQTLKEAWENAQFEEVGNIVAEKINNIINIANDKFSKLNSVSVKWASRIARVLNGLTDGIDWPLIGETLANGLNLITSTYNSFMNTYDFGALGKSIGESINSFVTNTDWESLGQAFAQKWQAIIDFVYNLVHEVDWVELGSSIGTGIQGWFDTIDWVKLANSIVTGFNGLVTSLRNIITTIDWEQIGSELGQSLTELVTEIDWGNIAGLLSDAVIGLLDLCIGLATDIDWFAIGDSLVQGVVDMIENIDWLQILMKLGSALVSLLGGAMELLLGIWSKEYDVLADLLEACGLDSIAGFFRGMADAMRNIAKFIKEKIVEPVVNGVKDFFGIHSPSTVFAGFGKNLIEGFKNGITNTLKNIGSWISEKFSVVKTKVVEVVDNIGTAIKKPLNAIISGFESLVNGVINGINTMIRALNKLSFDVPDWVPAIGGEKFGFSIKEISKVSIPRLAQGTVIPPNKEFLAMLGDQKHGTNIEAPLDTIKQAVAEVLAEMGNMMSYGDINLNLNGRTIAKAVWDEEEKRFKQTGSYRPTYT